MNNTFKGFAQSCRLMMVALLVAWVGCLLSAKEVRADTIRIGYISPLTGDHAQFSETDPFVISKVKALLKDGLKIGNKTYQVEILQKDSQSNPDRAGNLAAQLMLNDDIDLLLIQDSLGSVTASDQAELNEVPSISTNMPWQAWMFPRKGDPKVGFDWTFHFFWGLEDIIAAYTDIWQSTSTDKKVGTFFLNGPDGDAFASDEFGIPAALKRIGYQDVKTGNFQVGTADFSPQITEFKNNNTDIVTGIAYVNDFSTFWSQAQQQGLKPKIVTMAAALLFPSGVEALGDKGDGLTTEVWWSPGHPFKSSLTGQTARQLADQYEKETGRQWTQPLGIAHAIWEIGIEALKRSGDPHNHAAVRDALAQMKMKTIVGDIDWPDSPIKNVSKTPVVGGQWRLGGKYKYQLQVTNNGPAPEIPVQAKLKLLNEL